MRDQDLGAGATDEEIAAYIKKFPNSSATPTRVKLDAPKSRFEATMTAVVKTGKGIIANRLDTNAPQVKTY